MITNYYLWVLFLVVEERNSRVQTEHYIYFDWSFRSTDGGGGWSREYRVVVQWFPTLWNRAIKDKPLKSDSSRQVHVGLEIEGQTSGDWLNSTAANNAQRELTASELLCSLYIWKATCTPRIKHIWLCFPSIRLYVLCSVIYWSSARLIGYEFPQTSVRVYWA